jgi:hypothetical protein
MGSEPRAPSPPVTPGNDSSASCCPAGLGSLRLHQPRRILSGPSGYVNGCRFCY